MNLKEAKQNDALINPDKKGLTYSHTECSSSGLLSQAAPGPPEPEVYCAQDSLRYTPYVSKVSPWICAGSIFCPYIKVLERQGARSKSCFGITEGSMVGARTLLPPPPLQVRPSVSGCALPELPVEDNFFE